MVKRSASVRRAALDSFGVQLNAQYAKLLSAYERTVEQRNSLLRDCPAPELLEAWDESLAATGAQLLMHRRALLARIRMHFVDVYRVIAPHEEPDVAYESTIGELGEGREEISSQFLGALHERRTDEVRRGAHARGPAPRRDILHHRWALGARLWEPRPAAIHRACMEDRRGGGDARYLGPPALLLLDDVMSELDATRREAIMGFVAQEVQTVITTTNLGYFSDEVLGGAKVVRVGSID